WRRANEPARAIPNPQTQRTQSSDYPPCSQPAWQWINTLPPLASVIERLGFSSSCAGQRAIQPPPTLRAPRAFTMPSAAMASLDQASVMASFVCASVGPQPARQRNREHVQQGSSRHQPDDSECDLLFGRMGNRVRQRVRGQVCADCTGGVGLFRAQLIALSCRCLLWRHPTRDGYGGVRLNGGLNWLSFYRFGKYRLNKTGKRIKGVGARLIQWQSREPIDFSRRKHRIIHHCGRPAPAYVGGHFLAPVAHSIDGNLAS